LKTKNFIKSFSSSKVEFVGKMIEVNAKEMGMSS